MICPPDFGAMAVGWHLNHSLHPNAAHSGDPTHHNRYVWHAARDIKAGEEITIDYNTLEEPEDTKDEYYST